MVRVKANESNLLDGQYPSRGSGGRIKVVSFALLGLVLIGTGKALGQLYPNYECTPDLAAGMYFNEQTRSWQTASFTPGPGYVIRRYTEKELSDQMLLTTNYKWGVFMKGEDFTIVRCPEPNQYMFICGGLTNRFVFNTNSMRFQSYYEEGYVAGTDSPGNTPFIAIGRCKLLKPNG